ncbi:MAG: hypothetical protein Q8T04_00365, partial [Bacteroidota bacterium]|nr:hypothetical protein [Bacteroidota bacterium]
MKRKLHFVVLLSFLSFIFWESSAQVKLADWNFDFVYSTSTSGDSTYYTPTATALAADPNITISNSKFAVFPDSYIGNKANYTLGTKTTYSQLKTGYNNYILRLMFQGPNTITDFTNAAKHNHYFEFSFPTTGYDGISLNFSMAGGQNSVDDYLEAVYSIDGGTNWVDAGSYNSASGWWTYNSYSVAISARNKENVIVRLIGCTASTSQTATFMIDNFNVTGIVYEGGQTVDAKTTVTWPFGLGTAGQVATFSEGTADYFSRNFVSVGGKIPYKDFNTTYDITYTRFQPTEQLGSASPEGMVGFSIRPKTGLNFTPTAISFDCMRYGTDGGSIDVIWKSTDGTST